MLPLVLDGDLERRVRQVHAGHEESQGIEDVHVQPRFGKVRVDQEQAAPRLHPRRRPRAHPLQGISQRGSSDAASRLHRRAQLFESREGWRVAVEHRLPHGRISRRDQIVSIDQHAPEHRPRARRRRQPNVQHRMHDDTGQRRPHLMPGDTRMPRMPERREDAHIQRTEFRVGGDQRGSRQGDPPQHRRRDVAEELGVGHRPRQQEGACLRFVSGGGRGRPQVCPADAQVARPGRHRGAQPAVRAMKVVGTQSRRGHTDVARVRHGEGRSELGGKRRAVHAASVARRVAVGVSIRPSCGDGIQIPSCERMVVGADSAARRPRPAGPLRSVCSATPLARPRARSARHAQQASPLRSHFLPAPIPKTRRS